ncbi:MAG: outer membrane beta-barrel protein [Burkholderiales bacterium]
MNQLRACLSVSGALLLTALYGLLSAPPTYAEEDARRATPPPGKALVFVFRSEREPVAAQVPVIVNTVLVGELANGTFVIATVSPGRTYLRIGDRVLNILSLVAAAGQSYFVRVEAIAGLTPVRTEARLVSETEGRTSLAQSRFIGVAPAAMAATPPTRRPSVSAQPAATPPAAVPKIAATPPTTRPPIVAARPAAAQPAAAPKIAAAPPTARPPIVAARPAAAQPAAAPKIAAAPPAQEPSYAAKPATTQPAAAPEISASTESGRDWNFALIANGGTFKMANGNQVLAGLATTYDTSSKSVFGVEAEWRSKANFAVGGEIFQYKNDLVATGPILGQQEVLVIMVNGKHYFRVANWFHPFAGAGVGYTNAAYSGGFAGKTTGLAYQGVVGMEFRFQQVGLYVQYKYLASTPGSTGNEVKVGGSGILAGVSIVF